MWLFVKCAREYLQGIVMIGEHICARGRQVETRVIYFKVG